jgi:high affinity sulfate transporter 1
MFEGLAPYRVEWAKDDAVAGLTTAAVVIPKSMAYATVAGLPIEVGLYTAFVPMLVYALLGTSRPLSVSTTTTLAILTGAQLSEVVPSGDATQLVLASALLTMMVGGVLMLAAALRLGFTANFISLPVLVGFKSGIAIVIIVDQLPKLLGVHFAKGTFLHNVIEVGRGFAHVSWPTLAVGLVTVAILAAVEHLRPRWPAPLIALAGAVAAVVLFALQRHGVEVVGAIPSGLPSVTLPADWSIARQLWPGAVGIALMSFTETIAAGRAFQARNEPAPRANVELLAIGAANLGGALLGSMPAGGGTSQTAVNRLTGAQTQAAAIVTAITTLITMLLLAPLLGLMPQASLAAVVIVYSIVLISPADFRDILRIRRTEFVWALAAFAGVMLLGTLQGILVAIVVSLVALSQQTANPPVYELGRKRGTNVFRPRSAEHPTDEFFPGLLLLRIEGRLFFANADRVTEKIQPLVAAAQPKFVVLDLSGVFDLEYSALKSLIEAERSLREEGVSLVLAGLGPGVLEMVRRSPLGEALGRERLIFNLEMAVDKLAPAARDAKERVT